MAKGLEEGSLLGKFVSSAVINVVKDKRAFERALAGEKREMTIFFASLKTSSNSEAESFVEQLTLHLKSCQEAVLQSRALLTRSSKTKFWCSLTTKPAMAQDRR
ncbi:MAG: hypothetical protein A2W80_09570 [Candidatus Riflebacteria bacterium GWC2_50_8]|nr:MAG: hypothetical protein A2W80_09570 [Candidatus Riflebacteria bacterium GWC2_50_8]